MAAPEFCGVLHSNKSRGNMWTNAGEYCNWIFHSCIQSRFGGLNKYIFRVRQGPLIGTTDWNVKIMAFYGSSLAIFWELADANLDPAYWLVKINDMRIIMQPFLHWWEEGNGEDGLVLTDCVTVEKSWKKEPLLVNWRIDVATNDGS